jgi:hypothetical protein
VIDGFVVGGLIQQVLELSNVGNLNFSNPALTLGAGVDSLNVILQNGVAADDLASHGGEDVRSRLDGLDGTDSLAGTDLKVGFGELDEDNVAQGLGGVLGDTDLGCGGR